MAQMYEALQQQPPFLTMLALKGVRKPSVPMAKEMTGGSGASSEPNREARCSTVPSPVGQKGRDAANDACVAGQGGRGHYRGAGCSTVQSSVGQKGQE